MAPKATSEANEQGSVGASAHRRPLRIEDSLTLWTPFTARRGWRGRVLRRTTPTPGRFGGAAPSMSNPQRRRVRREEQFFRGEIPFPRRKIVSLRFLRPEAAGFQQKPVGVVVAGELAPPSTRVPQAPISIGPGDMCGGPGFAPRARLRARLRNSTDQSGERPEMPQAFQRTAVPSPNGSKIRRFSSQGALAPLLTLLVLACIM